MVKEILVLTKSRDEEGREGVTDNGKEGREEASWHKTN